MQIKRALYALILLTAGLFLFWWVQGALGPDEPRGALASPSTSMLSNDAMDHISPQARAFIAANRPLTLDGPLTPERARQMRKQQAVAEEESLNALQNSLGFFTQERVIHGVRVLVITPRGYAKSNDGKMAMYIHGGGYALKSALDASAVLMSSALGLRVFSIEYRLAPEHPFPEALRQCLAVYEELVQEFDPQDTVMLGGSAGGGLVLATLLSARDNGLPLPKAVGLFSPWSDLTRTGDSYYANEGRDPILKWEGNIEYFAASYAGGNDPRQPLLSPVYGDYTGFPSTMIISGTRDLFLSNSVRLSRVMQRAGVVVELQIWDEMFHGFDLMPDLPEGKEARQTMSTFLLDALAQ